MSNDVYVNPWEFVPAATTGGTGTLKWNESSFVACPTGKEISGSQVFELYSAKLSTKEGCTGVGISTAEWTGPQAYEYV